MLTMAAFYSPRPDHPYWRDDYIDMLKLQQQSCYRWDVRHVVLTDEIARLQEFNTYAIPLPQSLMRASLVAQCYFLNNWAQGDIILCDADGVLGKDPHEVFDGSFDVGVTTYPFPDSILNNGAMFIATGCAQKAVPFWDRAIAMVTGDEWGEDQAALRDAFSATLTEGVEMRGSTRVRFFSCDGYNQAPEEVDDGIDSYFVHFRGDRKVWAAEWVKRWL